MTRVPRSVACLALALFLLAPRSAHAQEWSRFRGPNGSGIAETTALPTSFGPEENVRWRTEVGFGRSSPILTKDAVYLTASNEDDLLVLCLDRASGEARWERRIERAREVERYHGTDASAPTPVTDGENVYAFFQELGLISFDAKGEQRWVHPVKPFNSFYGQAGSPVLAGDVLLMPCDAQSDSYLLAVGKDDGKERWRVDRSEVRESWTTPVLYPSAAKPEQVIVFGFKCIRSYAVGTGEEKWRLGNLGTSPITSPIVYDQLLFVCTPYEAEMALPPFALMIGMADKDKDGKLNKDEGGKDLAEHFGWLDANKDGFIDEKEWSTAAADMLDENHGLVAFDLGGLEDGEPVEEMWRQQKNLPAIATPLFYEGVMYVVKDGGIVSTVDPVTGEILQRRRIPDGDGPYFPSPVAGDGKIFFASNAGKVAVLAAGENGEVLAVNDLDEELNATPAIGRDGTLFVRTASSLYCFVAPK